MSGKPEEPWRGLGEFIKAQRELANLSLRQLSDLAKVSNPYLSQLERGLYKPSADVLKNIAEARKHKDEALKLDPKNEEAKAITL